MNTILLRPVDVLFFKDGRPMEGSLAGHGAAWPLPTVISGAFHAALHRAGFTEVHKHRRGSAGKYNDNYRDKKFGSLKTVGPFPVLIEKDGQKEIIKNWYFPRPCDLVEDNLKPSLYPTNIFDSLLSSLPDPLEYPVASAVVPSKNMKAKAWLSKQAFEDYLNGKNSEIDDKHSLNDGEIFGVEHTIGIAIDPESGTTGGSQTSKMIYSAHYLRVKEDWRLGVFASAEDKEFKHELYGNDLVRALLNGGGKMIIVGGQQRVCTADVITDSQTPLPLPVGKSNGFNNYNGKHLVKWVLLTPAIYPEILNDESNGIKYHPGGWLPNWIDAHEGRVLLKAGNSERKTGETREEWRRRVQSMHPINARLVAAIVPKSVVVTGWSLGDEDTGEQAGAMSAHLAVAAGAVYYFEADSEQDAVSLSDALNWHGAKNGDEKFGKTIKNHRSTLLGEKGFGIGVCGTFNFKTTNKSTT